MKRLLLAATVFASIFIAQNVYAYSSTIAPEWLIMPSKYATVDGPEAAIFNPAGLVKLADGAYVGFGNLMSVVKTNEFELNGQNNEYDDTTLFSPDLYAVYKRGGWAVFFTAYRIGGGGGVDFKDVNVLDLPGDPVYVSLKGNDTTLGYTLGGSFALNEMVSLGFGIRMFHNWGDQQADVRANATLGLPAGKYENESTAYGCTGLVSVNVNPVKGLNIGVMFQPEASMYTKTKTTDPNNYSAAFAAAGLDVAADGKSTDVDTQPAMIAFGVGYTILPDLLVQASGSVTFEKEREWGGSSYVDNYENQDNSWKAAIGAQYRLTPLIKVSGGVQYTNSQATEESLDGIFDKLNPDLDMWSVGCGAVITPVENLDVTVGAMKHIYITAEDTDGNKLKKGSLAAIGLGVSYKLL
jgi:long-subunit fatty acid transport protein